MHSLLETKERTQLKRESIKRVAIIDFNLIYVTKVQAAGNLRTHLIHVAFFFETKEMKCNRKTDRATTESLV